MKVVTYWKNSKKPTKRYALIFQTYTDKKESQTITEYDTLDQVREEIKLINTFYNSTPSPERVYKTSYHSKYDKDGFKYVFENGAKFWGWALMDFEKCQFTEVGGQGLYGGVSRFLKKKDLNTPKLLDYYFRDTSVVPDDYEFKPYEYDGWLRYRWGDGKNALNYKKPEKQERPGVTELREYWDEVDEVYKQKRVRVVKVPFDGPIPEKRWPGVLYEYPNGAPVIFPGEIGFSEEDFPSSCPEECYGSEVDDYISREKKSTKLIDSLKLKTSDDVKAALCLDGLLHS